MIPEKKLAGIVGVDHVSSRKKVLEEFGKDMSFVNAIMPGLVIRPDTAAQVEDIVNLAIYGHFGVPHHVWSDALHDMYGPCTSNYHLLLKQIKKNFDPNQASESSNYISAKERLRSDIMSERQVHSKILGKEERRLTNS